jgi:C_GCAxxG_C_C family probable redox protein
MNKTKNPVQKIDRKGKAIDYFRNKYNCSQSVFTAFGTDFGITEDECLKIACAFGGGMGRQQFTCGAVTGALMALGLKYGRALNDPEEKKQITYSKAREFFEEFKKLHGSLNCRDLLDGLDMNDPEEHEKIVEQKLFEIQCEEYISDAVGISEKIMNNI